MIISKILRGLGQGRNLRGGGGDTPKFYKNMSKNMGSRQVVKGICPEKNFGPSNVRKKIFEPFF